MMSFERYTFNRMRQLELSNNCESGNYNYPFKHSRKYNCNSIHQSKSIDYFPSHQQGCVFDSCTREQIFDSKCFNKNGKSDNKKYQTYFNKVQPNKHEEERGWHQTKITSKRSMNKEIAIVILLFAAQTFSELDPSFTTQALSTEIIANSFSYPSADSAFRAGERCYAESEATMDYVYEKFSASIGSSEGVTMSITRSELSDDQTNDDEDNDDEEDEHKEKDKMKANRKKRETSKLENICNKKKTNERTSNNFIHDKWINIQPPPPPPPPPPHNHHQHQNRVSNENGEIYTVVDATNTLMAPKSTLLNCNVSCEDKDSTMTSKVYSYTNANTTKYVKSNDVYVLPQLREQSEHLEEKKHYRRFAKQQQFAKSELWQDVLEFLPWREILEVRRVSKFHFCRSLPFVAVCRLPFVKTPAFFISTRDDFDANECIVEKALQPSLFSKSQTCKCKSNQYDNYQVRNNEVDDNMEFTQYNYAAREKQTAQRLFLGQLRRNGTVPMVQWLVNYVFDAPARSLICVENHRNAITSRGKGCAWPTIADSETVKKMLSAHHRLYYDVIDSVEGVWVMPQRYANSLIREVQHRASLPNRPKHLPRGTMVMELPAPIQTHARNKCLWNELYNHVLEPKSWKEHNECKSLYVRQLDQECELQDENLFQSNLKDSENFATCKYEQATLPRRQINTKANKCDKIYIELPNNNNHQGKVYDDTESRSYKRVIVTSQQTKWRHNPYYPLLF